MNRIVGLIPVLGLLFFVSLSTPGDAAADDPFQKRFAASDQALKVARGGLQQAVDFANQPSGSVLGASSIVRDL